MKYYYFQRGDLKNIFAMDPIHQAWTPKDRLSQWLGPKQLTRITDL